MTVGSYSKVAARLLRDTPEPALQCFVPLTSGGVLVEPGERVELRTQVTKSVRLLVELGRSPFHVEAGGDWTVELLGEAIYWPRGTYISVAVTNSGTEARKFLGVLITEATGDGI